MTEPIEWRALAACRAYVAAQSEIKRLGREIGDAINACPNHMREELHLSIYYKNKAIAYEIDDDSEVKGEAEFLACPHCVKADALIQLRKTARRKLGAARRAVTMIGKSK